MFQVLYPTVKNTHMSADPCPSREEVKSQTVKNNLAGQVAKYN